MGNKFLLKGIEKNGQHYPGNTENHLFFNHISPYRSGKSGKV